MVEGGSGPGLDQGCAGREEGGGGACGDRSEGGGSSGDGQEAHAAQLDQFRSSLAQIAQVRITGCLDSCEHANVIVIQPSAAGRAAGGRPVWLGLVNDRDAADDIAAWVEAGGSGLADPPDVLDLYAFSSSRRIRQAIEP